jgi:branched-chain amino acid transport system permease protein
MEYLIFSIVNGILYGLLIFMLSSGLTLIFGIMGVLNFAHASFYMLGAYLAFAISQLLGFWPGLIIAPVVVAGLGGLLERYGLRKVHVFGHTAQLVLTFGVSYIIGEVVKLIWGKVPVDYVVPKELDFILFNISGTGFHAYKGFMMVVAIFMFLGVYILIKKTTLGMIIQAALSNSVMVGELGHNVSSIFTGIFAVGCGMAALAGVISGNLYITDPQMADRLGLIIFVVVIVGGFGSLTGALVASLFIGVIQTFAAGLNYSLADFLIYLGFAVSKTGLLNLAVSQTSEMIPFLLMVLILIFRPKGLMGVRET